MATAEQYAEWIVANKDKQGTPEFDTVAAAYKEAKGMGGNSEPQEEKGFIRNYIDNASIDNVIPNAKNLIGGLFRGAGSMGATIDSIGKMLPQQRIGNALQGKYVDVAAEDKALRQSLDDGLESMGVDTDSAAYQVGKLGAEVAGTAGMPIAAGRAVGTVAPKFGNAIATGGFKLGGSSGNVAQNALLRTAGGAASGGMMTGAVNPEDAATGAVIGAAIPASVKAVGKTGQIIGKGARAVIGDVSPEVAKLAKRASELGVEIPADRLVDSKPLNATASSLNYIPFSGRAATEQKMVSGLNKALSKTFGQNSENVTLALRKAKEQLGGQFDDVLKSNKLKVDDQFLDELAEVESIANRELGSDSLKPIMSQIDEILAKSNNGVIDGQAAYNIKRTLDRYSRGSRPEAFHATELKKSLMDALNRSLSPSEVQRFSTVRKQYGNMLSLEKLAQNGVEGDISVGRLANLKNINNPELQEIADIAAQFIKSREGQHGAAQRVVAGGALALTTGPTGLAAGAAGGRAVNSLLNSNAVKSRILREPQKLVEGSKNRLLEDILKTTPVIYAQ